MTDGPPRRHLLEALAASGIAASIAGCLDTLEADSGVGTGSASADDLPDPACEVGEAIVEAYADGDFETVVSYYPLEHFENESLDQDALAAELADSEEYYDWVGAETDDISCECGASYPADARAELDADTTADVVDAVELRYAITDEGGDETTTESVFVDVVEFADTDNGGDEGRYGILSPWGSPELCGEDPPRDRDSDGANEAGDDPRTAEDQALEPDDWAAVDEIVLEGLTGGWIGVEPDPIAGVENPTLLLFEGQEYTIGWEQGDGAMHNVQLRDGDGEVIAETDLDDEGASLTVEATAALESYVCEPHANRMAGRLEIERE